MTSEKMSKKKRKHLLKQIILEDDEVLFNTSCDRSRHDGHHTK